MPSMFVSPALAVNRVALFSVATTTSRPVDPVAPMDYKSACLKIRGKISTLDFTYMNSKVLLIK